MLFPRLLPTRRPEAAPTATRSGPRRADGIATEVRPVLDLALDAVSGFDVLVFGPSLRLGSAPTADVALTARFTLNEVQDRAELFAFNEALVNASLRCVEATDVLDVSSPLPDRVQSFVAVALHARFIGQAEFLDSVKAMVRRAGVDPQRMLLSVAPDPDLDRVWPALQRLRSHGVRIALEHDGPSDECSELLHRLPFDVVRLPAASVFEASSCDGPEPSIALQRLVAQERGRVWIEDVRTTVELDALRAVGCGFVSGAAVGYQPST